MFKILLFPYDVIKGLMNINEAAWIQSSWMLNIKFQIEIFQKPFKIIWCGFRRSPPYWSAFKYLVELKPSYLPFKICFSYLIMKWYTSHEYTQHIIIVSKIEKTSLNYRLLLPDLAWLTLSGSNYPCLEQHFLVPKTFEPLKYDCTRSELCLSG